MLVFLLLIAQSAQVTYDLFDLESSFLGASGEAIFTQKEETIAADVAGLLSFPGRLRLSYQVLAPNVFLPRGVALPIDARIGPANGLGPCRVRFRLGAVTTSFEFSGHEELAAQTVLDTSSVETIDIPFAFLLLTHENVPALPVGVFIPVQGSVHGSGTENLTALGSASLRALPLRLGFSLPLGTVRFGFGGAVRFFSGRADLKGHASLGFPELVGRVRDYPNPFYPSDWKVNIALKGRADLDTAWADELSGAVQGFAFSLRFGAAGRLLGTDWRASLEASPAASFSPGLLNRLVYLGNVTPSLVTSAQDLVVDTTGHEVNGTWEVDLGRVPLAHEMDSTALPYRLRAGARASLSLERLVGPGELLLGGNLGLGASRSSVIARYALTPFPLYFGLGAEWRRFFWPGRSVLVGPLLLAGAGLHWEVEHWQLNLGLATTPLLLPAGIVPSLRSLGTACGVQAVAGVTVSI